MSTIQFCLNSTQYGWLDSLRWFFGLDKYASESVDDRNTGESPPSIEFS